MSIPPGLRMVSEAAELAARRHTGMQRKGRPGEPYVNHLAEVANLLAQASDGNNAELVAAGWLHDTIEDTGITGDELADLFGNHVASLVSEVTDDMTLPKAERRRRQIDDARKKSSAAKLIKIADKISNIRARIVADPSEADCAELADYVGWAENVVVGCRGENPILDRQFDETVRNARSKL